MKYFLGRAKAKKKKKFKNGQGELTWPLPTMIIATGGAIHNTTSRIALCAISQALYMP